MSALATVTIPNQPESSQHFQICCCSVTVGLSASLRKKTPTTELTGEVAIPSLKQIKRKSDVLSFLTNPKVFTVLSVAVLLAGVFLPIFALSLVVCFVGGAMLGYAIVDACRTNKTLPSLSEAYKKQSTDAEGFIKAINAERRANDTVTVMF